LAWGLTTCEGSIPYWLTTCQPKRLTTYEIPIYCWLTTCRPEDWQPAKSSYLVGWQHVSLSDWQHVKSPYLVGWQHVGLSDWWPTKSLYLNMSAWAIVNLWVRVEVVLSLCTNNFLLGFEWRPRCFSTLVPITFDWVLSGGRDISRPWYQSLLIGFWSGGRSVSRPWYQSLLIGFEVETEVFHDLGTNHFWLGF